MNLRSMLPIAVWMFIQPVALADYADKIVVGPAKISPPNNFVQGPVKTNAKGLVHAVWRQVETVDGIRAYLDMTVGPASSKMQDLDAGIREVESCLLKDLSPGGEKHMDFRDWKFSPAEDVTIHGAKFRKANYSASMPSGTRIYGLIYISITPSGYGVSMTALTAVKDQLKVIDMAVQSFEP